MDLDTMEYMFMIQNVLITQVKIRFSMILQSDINNLHMFLTSYRTTFFTNYKLLKTYLIYNLHIIIFTILN